MNNHVENHATESTRTNPVITVVMATYAGDNVRFLGQSVDSILGQSYRDFEYLIVIDGPVGSSLQTYLDGISDPRVRIIPITVNGGPARARNIAIQQARGYYIAIQDADDVSDHDRLQKQKTYLESRNLDLTSSCVNQIDDDGRIVARKAYPEDSKKVRSLMPFINSINNSAVFCRADLLKQHPYDERLRFGEDYLNWVTWLKHDYRMGNCPEYLVSYRLASSRRRGWKTAKVDMQIKLAALSIAPWYQRPLVILTAILTMVIRLTPAWVIVHVYRIKEYLFPKFAGY